MMKRPTLTDRSHPPTQSSPRLIQNTDDAGTSRFDKRIEFLKNELSTILKSTEWPTDSTGAAEGLLSTINSSPDISISLSLMTKELQNVVERYMEILEDVRLRLKDASSKAEMKRWKFLQRMKSLAFNRPSKCTSVLQTCQDDVSKALSALKERLDYERAKGARTIAAHDMSETDYPFCTKEDCNGVSEFLQEAETHAPEQSKSNSLPQDPRTGPAKPGLTSDNPTPTSLSVKHSPSNIPNESEVATPIGDQALAVIKKTFKTVEIASGTIPVVGSYVGAVAKIGLAFVETLETMDRNDSLAIDLGNRTSKLNKLVENFKGRSTVDETDIAGQISGLQKELALVKDKVEEWSSLGRFQKAFSAGDHADTLNNYQGRIQIAREEIQLLVGLDSRNIIVELENIELRKERRRLLDRLGDGQYGARGITIQDIICFPGTRLEILSQIDDWIRDTSHRQPALWIRGMAGRGKSTIASTVVHAWKGRAACAIFHFRRGHSTVNSRVICALARQLGNSLVSDVKEAILESVRENEDIADPGRRLDEQFETLFAAPFVKLGHQNYPILVVIDALDECDSPKEAVELVRLIHKHSPSFPTNVKFLLTSRPENAILRGLGSNSWHKVDLDSTPDINNDLARFLEHACSQVRQEHDLSQDWPSSGDIEKLVQMSQGLFQWARTVVTYLGDGSPADRLRALLRRPSAWSGLDDLYHQILSKAFNSLRLDPIRQDILSKVLGILVVAPHPVSLEVIATIYEEHDVFDGGNREDIISFLRKDILADLNPLLFIPESPAESMLLMHTSIQDLLTSELRSKRQPFYIDPVQSHQQLASVCLKTMLGCLKENICNLSDVSKPSSDLKHVVEQGVSKGTQYCCRAWSTHLIQGVTWLERKTTAELVYFETFSEGKIMYWLEVMSLVGASKEAIVAANHVCQWFSQRPGEVLEPDPFAALWDDVQRFITTFLEPISFGPLHIYTSALPQCPTETEIWKLYGKHAKVHVLQGHQMSTWPSNLWTRSLNSEVRTIAFSPDGHILAVGSEDETIRLLDAQTGTAVGKPLTGHSGAVWSLCFSPNGKLLASASSDSTIRLWDAEAGVVVGEPLKGHVGGLWSVCFSLDGKLLASGGVDQTVRLWNTQTRITVGEPLKGHNGEVISVCFSSDGRLLASGSADKTIRLWDPQTGLPFGEPLTGHSNAVRSLRFSSDGKLLASGSDDKTIRVWAPDTRMLVQELAGHSDGINSICFLSDSGLLASGSDDRTVRLWNTQTGAAMGEPLAGHNGFIWSVSCSPDGRLLASGSEDKTVRLWDPLAGEAAAGSLIRHRAMVNSVCFSPDGKRLVSGSNDRTLRLWDPQTGAAVGEPLLGHHDWVTRVCFSRDGKVLASGSMDRTVRLWNAQTGVALGEPLRGHSGWIQAVCFSLDGEYLASGSSDGTIRLWNAHTGAVAGEPLTGHSDWVQSVTFSPDGKYLASGSDDGTIRLWDPQTGAVVGEPLTGHSDFVLSVSFSSDGTVLVAQCRDGSVATWDPITCQRCDSPQSLLAYDNPHFHDRWITCYSSRFIWLPPQYWNIGYNGVALFDGLLAAFQNGSLSILDVSQVLRL